MKGKEKVEKSDYGLGLAISSVPDFFALYLYNLLVQDVTRKLQF